MYPAQTSMMPVQVALARFIEQGGDIFGNYPYWYLGTTPFRYLTGPILPFLLIGIHKALPQLSLFTIFYLLITIAWALGAAGVYLLIRELGKEKKLAVLSAVFYAFGPIVPFLFRFSDGLYLITFSFLPFTLLAYLRLLRRWERKLAAVCVLLMSFLILLDSLIVPSLLLGLAAIFLAQVGWKRAEEKLRQTFFIFLFSILFSTLWYTPGYWLTLLGAPSLAGKGLAGVIFWLGKLLPTVLAFGIAIFSVKFFKKKNLLRDFCFYWLFIFGFLTLMRFISDPDFWLDWTSYNLELQLGLAILGGLVLSRFLRGPKYKILNIKNFLFLLCVFSIWFLVFSFTFNKYVIGTLQKDITQAVEYRISNQLSEIARSHSASSGQAGERVFLSGTTAFWLNAFFDIPQVRGGVDQASVDPNWRKAVWETREGPSTSSGREKSLRWLRDLSVSYLVVHTEESEEFYHDFTYPEKFEGVEGLKKVYDEGGDRIYVVEDR